MRQRSGPSASRRPVLQGQAGCHQTPDPYSTPCCCGAQEQAIPSPPPEGIFFVRSLRRLETPQKVAASGVRRFDSEDVSGRQGSPVPTPRPPGRPRIIIAMAVPRPSRGRACPAVRTASLVRGPTSAPRRWWFVCDRPCAALCRRAQHRAAFLEIVLPQHRRCWSRPCLDRQGSSVNHILSRRRRCASSP